jgi:hypothetical protein
MITRKVEITQFDHYYIGYLSETKLQYFNMETSELYLLEEKVNNINVIESIKFKI